MSSDDLGRRLEELAAPVRRQVRPPELATLHRLARRRRRRLAGATTGMAVVLAAVVAVGVGLVPVTPADGPPVAEPSSPGPLPRSQFGGVQTTEPTTPSTTAPLAAEEATPAPSPGPSPAAAPTSTSQPTRTVKVFFWAKLGPEGRCVAPAARTRRVLADAPVRRTLRQLLLGPTGHERSRGLGAAFQDAAETLRSFRVEDGTAHVDFADLSGLALDPPGTPCRAAKVLRPLDATLRQFPWVKRTRYTLGGSEQAFEERLGIQPAG